MGSGAGLFVDLFDKFIKEFNAGHATEYIFEDTIAVIKTIRMLLRRCSAKIVKEVGVGAAFQGVQKKLEYIRATINYIETTARETRHIEELLKH